VTCAQIADFLTDFLSGELPDAVHADFVAHMVICPDCQRYLNSFRKTIALGRGAFDPVSEVTKMPESLVQAILRARES
jgi:anti-sigma factor RsiW